MSDNSIKTVHHAKLEQKRSLDIAFTADVNSTLNEYFNIADTEAVPALAPPNDNVHLYPVIQYLAAGIYPISENTGNQPPRHRSTDGRLFKMIPWVFRASGNDLAPQDRVKYRFRVEVVGTPVVLPNMGITLQVGYIYYFIKVLDLNAVSPILYSVTVTNGIASAGSQVTIQPTDLENPQPVDIDNPNLYQVTGEHRVVQSAISVNLNTTDISDLVSTVTHLLGSSEGASITEFALISGFDHPDFYAPNEGEVSHAQVCSFIGTNIPMQGLPNAVNLTFALTSAMPHPNVLVP